MVPRTEPPRPRIRPELVQGHPKPSFQSPSPSSEADDERSLFDAPDMQRPSVEMRAPVRYPGEDTRPTSKKELAGWYSYGWAAEVFVICGIGSFIPITLEQLARERGVLLSDRSTPCRPSFEAASAGRDNVATSASRVVETVDNGQCVIYLLGAEINTASFAMYTFSLSVFLQALLIISMSGAADHGAYRKLLLLVCAFIGSFSTMLFLLVVPKVYILGALLAIVANVSFGMSSVFFNSFLPILVRYDPSLPSRSETFPPPFASGTGPDDEGDESAMDSLMDSTAALLPQPASASSVVVTRQSSSKASPELQLSTRISSYGTGIGYTAAVLLQTIAVFIVIFTGSSTFSLRLVLFVIGLWWFAFSIPAALWLRPRPGPPLPGNGSGNKRRTWSGYIAYAWKRLGKTVMRAGHLRDVVLFLSAWFLLSDGMATVSGTAVLFAKTELKMKTAALASLNIISTICGIIGAFSWSRISKLIGLRPSHTILACIFLFELIPLYGLLGYVPAIRRMKMFGLQQAWEMYPLSVIYGFVLGGLSSYCRGVYGELIPSGSEAAFFALYAITDKGSSVFGPAIVGLIADRVGDIRPAFIFLAIVIGLPAPLMWLVDVDRGRRDGARLVKELGESSDGTRRGESGLFVDPRDNSRANSQDDA